VTGTNQIASDYRLNETIGDLEHGEQVAPAPTQITPNSTFGCLSVDVGRGIGLDVITGYSINDYATIADPSPSYVLMLAFVYPPADAAAMPYAFRTRKFSAGDFAFPERNEVRLARGGFSRTRTRRINFLANAADSVTGAYEGVLFEWSTTSSGTRNMPALADVTVHLTPRFDIQAGGRSGHILRNITA